MALESLSDLCLFLPSSYRPGPGLGVTAWWVPPLFFIFTSKPMSTDEMRCFLETLSFPSSEIMDDSLSKLLREAVTLKQLRALTKDECEEIGLTPEATDVMLKVCEKIPQVFQSRPKSYVCSL